MISSLTTLEDLRRPLLTITQQLGLTLSADQIDALLAYLALLQRWNAKYNLTAVRELDKMLVQHLADCLATLNPLHRHFPDGGRLLDVGSGGGLPGAVIAAANPSFDVVCVDTSGKKAAFVQQVASSLRLPNLRSVHARVERLAEPAFNVITCRAFSSLLDFTHLTQRHLKLSGVWMAMKGKLPQSEIAALPPETSVFHVEQLDVPLLNADRCLVWMRPCASLSTR